MQSPGTLKIYIPARKIKIIKKKEKKRIKSAINDKIIIITIIIIER